jgi:hypothetical protein
VIRERRSRWREGRRDSGECLLCWIVNRSFTAERSREGDEVREGSEVEGCIT